MRCTHTASDDVGDVHVLVVNYVGEVICGPAVRLHDYEVLLGQLLPEPMKNNIFDN